MSANILLEVSPRTPSGETVTLRMAHVSAHSVGTILDGHMWTPLISRRPTFSMELMDSDGNLMPVQSSGGSIDFRLAAVYENEIWSTFVWNKAQAKIWLGEHGTPFEEYTRIFTGSVSAISRDNLTATVELIGPHALLDTDLLTSTYAGTGGAEGTSDMEGAFKPWCSGYAKNVDPVLVDQAYWIYQVHGYGSVLDIPYVYERAEALAGAKMKASVSTYAQLASTPLAPGEWAVCLPLGMFRIGGAPRYKVTADVRGAKVGGSTPIHIATIVPHLLKKAGITATEIGDFTDFNGVTWDFYADSQVSVGDVVRDAMAQAGGVLIADGAGVWHGSDFYDYKAPLPLTANRSTFPLVRPASIKQLTVADPVREVQVGGSVAKIGGSQR